MGSNQAYLYLNFDPEPHVQQKIQEMPVQNKDNTGSYQATLTITSSLTYDRDFKKRKVNTTEQEVADIKNVMHEMGQKDPGNMV